MTRIKKFREILDSTKLDAHSKYLIFKQCIVPSANWGPYLEITNESEQEENLREIEKYQEIDNQLVEIINDFAGCSYKVMS